MLGFSRRSTTKQGKATGIGKTRQNRWERLEACGGRGSGQFMRRMGGKYAVNRIAKDAPLPRGPAAPRQNGREGRARFFDTAAGVAGYCGAAVESLLRGKM